MQKRDLTGERFGKLVALRKTGVDKYGNAVWECRCDCGNVKEIGAQNLRNGNTRSCGCNKKASCDISPQNYPPKKDCLAYRESKVYKAPYCEALTEMMCATCGECKFYKQKE